MRKDEKKNAENPLVNLPVFTYKEGKFFVSEVPFINVASQGRTPEEARKNVIEAVELYFEGEDIEKILAEKVPKPNTIVTSAILLNKKIKELKNKQKKHKKADYINDKITNELEKKTKIKLKGRSTYDWLAEITKKYDIKPTTLI